MKRPTSSSYRGLPNVLGSLAFAVALAWGGTFWLPASVEALGLPEHDANQVSQHDALTGQATSHNNAQTTQHNALSQQLTDVQTAIGNLSTSGVGRCDVPPVWGAAITTGRFVSVFGGAAYCDQETGLVWEASPSTTTQNWSSARFQCTIRTRTGGRKGWRLPSVHELSSLVDGDAVSVSALPAGHPFSIVQNGIYWSATTFADDPASAWNVNFFFLSNPSFDKTDSNYAWCVRGPMQESVY